jgi:hypothetical protein
MEYITVSEGKLEQLIKQKRDFLRQATKDYSSGGNDMLDDVESTLKEAKEELSHRLDVASCLLQDEGKTAWLEERTSIFNAWFEKWLGTS